MNLKLFKNHKVVKAGSWYILTDFFIKGITFLTIPIFTRLLSTEDYGIVSLYTTWVSIFTVVLGLSLNSSITKAKYDFKEDFDSYVSSIIFFSFLIFVLYILIFSIFNKKIQSIVCFSGFLFYFMLFQAYFSFIRTSLITKLRVEYKYKKISFISILINIIGVLLSIYLILYIYEDKTYKGKILGNGILIIIFGIFFLWSLLKAGNYNLINIQYWKYALKLSLPLLFASLSNLINSQFDRIVINQYIGESATGLYSFAYNVGMVVTVIASALDRAWSPWVYEKMGEGKLETIFSKGKIYRNIFNFAYACLLLLSPELIKLMASETYWESLVIVPYIFSGYYFIYMYTLEIKTEFFFNRTNLLFIGTLFSAILNVTLNLIFVPKYGYIAAAITTTISYFFLFVFHFIITTKIIKCSVYGLKFHVFSILYMVFVTLYYSLFVNNIIMRIIGLLLIVSINIYLVRKNKLE